jgi:hypothetical protein
MGMLGKIDFACEQVANVVIIMLEEGLQKVRIGETLNSVNILLNDMKEFLDSSEPMRPTLQKSRIEV